jgi:acyl-CoA thioester hydrolase
MNHSSPVQRPIYQHYLEQAAIEHSEHLGFSLERYKELGGVFVLRRVEIEYLGSAIAGDTLEIKTWLETMKGTRATRHYEIRRQSEEMLLVTAKALWVWVDETMRPRPIPKDFLTAFGIISPQATS